MRRPALFVLTIALAGCGGSGKDAQTTTTTAQPKAPPFAGAVARTTAAGTVRFEQRTQLTVAGSLLEAAERGTASLVARKARIYKQLTGGGVPGEIVVIGPVTYANSNVQAALNDPSVQPWTKLDTRKLTARERATQADELAHAVAPAFLAAGVAKPHLVASRGALTEYRGRVDTALLARRVPAAVRPWVLAAVAADYPAHGFDARFWLDRKGRVRRVLVTYKTPKGTPVGVGTAYSGFGANIDLSLPEAREIKDVTANR